MTSNLDQDLIFSVTIGYDLRVRKSLRKGANPNCCNEDGTPVILLASCESYENRNFIVDLLLAAGADEGPLLTAATSCDRYRWPASRYVRYPMGGGSPERIDRSRHIDQARRRLSLVKC